MLHHTHFRATGAYIRISREQNNKQLLQRTLTDDGDEQEGKRGYQGDELILRVSEADYHTGNENTKKQNAAQDTDIKKGNIITFSYSTVSSKGVPVDLQVIRKRADVSWEDVVQNYPREGFANSNNSNLEIPHPGIKTTKSKWLGILEDKKGFKFSLCLSYC